MAEQIKKYLDNLAAQELVNQIKAKDAEVLQGAKDYADGLAGNYDEAGAAATALADAKKYTDDQIVEKADAKGAAAAVDTKLTAEVQRATAKENEIVASVEAVDGKADANKALIDAINHVDTGILAQAKADATTKANAVQANVDALDGKVGNLPEGATATTVVGYVDEKVSEANADVTALDGRVTQAEKDIDNIEKDYLKSADKTELEGKITTAQNKADAAQTHSEGVASDLADEITARTKADEAQVGRIATLEEKIKGLSGAMHFKGVVAEIPTDKTGYTEGDVIIIGEKEYVFNGTDFAEFGDVSAQAQAITALTGRMDTAEGEIDVLQGEMDAVEAAVATKAEAKALADEIKARTDADKALDERLVAVETLVGEGGSVDDKIATAKQEAIDAAATDATTKADKALADAKKYADDEDAKIEARVDALEAKAHTHDNKTVIDGITAEKVTAWDNAGAKAHEHANKTVLDGITSEKVTAWDSAEQNAKGYADTEIAKDRARLDAVEAKATANANAVATKAEQADLTAAVERIATAEANIAANTSAINSFVPVTVEEIKAMFA